MDALTPDEALQLTVAMQYCGFRSVGGTLWAIADADGRDLSEHFYGHVFAAVRHINIGDRSARVA
jgi:CHAT domain-containing protein